MNFLFPTTHILEEDLKNCVQKRVTITSLRLLLSLEGPACLQVPALVWHLGPWVLECSLHSLMDKDDALCLDCTNTVINGAHLLYFGSLKFW